MRTHSFVTAGTCSHLLALLGSSSPQHVPRCCSSNLNLFSSFVVCLPSSLSPLELPARLCSTVLRSLLYLREFICMPPRPAPRLSAPTHHFIDFSTLFCSVHTLPLKYPLFAKYCLFYFYLPNGLMSNLRVAKLEQKGSGVYFEEMRDYVEQKDVLTPFSQVAAQILCLETPSL